MAVGLEALEDLLAVVQHSGGRVERDWTVGLNARTVPPTAGRPADVDHVVGEVLAEARVGEDRVAIGLGRGVLVLRAGELQGLWCKEVLHVWILY